MESECDYDKQFNKFKENFPTTHFSFFLPPSYPLPFSYVKQNKF